MVRERRKGGPIVRDRRRGMVMEPQPWVLFMLPCVNSSARPSPRNSYAIVSADIAVKIVFTYTLVDRLVSSRKGGWKGEFVYAIDTLWHGFNVAWGRGVTYTP